MSVHRPVRVLVVDDSVVIRRLVSDALDADPGLEVIGTAANGRLALGKIEQLAPDAVTLDIEMPELDGIETLRALRQTHPALPVIMFSTLTERAAAATLDALAAGANDYVTKPANVGRASDAIQQVRNELAPKILSWCGKAAAPGPATVRPPLQAPPPRATTPRRLDAVVIGVSTGGPNALAELLPALPADLPVPVVVVQHMPPVFTKILAERLNGRSGLDVAEAQGGEHLRAGSVWLAPGGRHLVVRRAGGDAVLECTDDPPENFCRPAVDVLFRSAAQAWGPATLGVVLTGMGHDGLGGSEVLRTRGADVIAQDRDSSVVWGMPGSVTEAGLAVATLPLGELAAEIDRRCRVGRSLTLGAGRGA